MSKQSDLLFPKPVWKKKKMRHQASILGSEKGVCYLCDKLRGDRSYKYTEEHHIMFGSGKRTDSEELGLKVYLCREHHREGKEAVHNNTEIREILCKEAQKAFEESHTRQEWMQRFKNYLDELPVAVDRERDTVGRPETIREEGAAGSIQLGDYVGYLWGENMEFGYILEEGQPGTVWIGEEPNDVVRRLVEIPNIFR